MILKILLSFLLYQFISCGPIDAEKSKNNRLDHLEGIPIERDGELNKKYRDEILLGSDEISEDDKKTKIDEMIKKSDMNGDGLLSVDELEKRIHLMKKEHRDESEIESKDLMEKVDENKDHTINWDEYSKYFIAKEGFEVNKNTGNIIGMDNTHQYEDEKNSFNRADEDDDGVLSKEEWTIFLHPENSPSMVERFAKELLESLDKNGDGSVSKEEFIDPHPGEVEESMKELEEEDRKEREREFNEDIDRNGDGKADIQELSIYVDPLHEDSAKREANQILKLSDENKDGYVSKEELFSKHFLLRENSLFDAKNSLHYDF